MCELWKDLRKDGRRVGNQADMDWGVNKALRTVIIKMRTSPSTGTILLKGALLEEYLLNYPKALIGHLLVTENTQ